MELGTKSDVLAAVLSKQRPGPTMFYVLDHSSDTQRSAITLDAIKIDGRDNAAGSRSGESYGDDDIDFVDDALLNTAPHNKIEQQLLRGDVVGLALMSGAILWSAMGAFG